MGSEITVSALVDCASKPAGKDIVHRIDQVEVPIAATGQCQHNDTICPECSWAWQLEYLFVETLPWERDTR
ncbi:hypothetical protein [Nocardia vulneris]|uniref:Uncharacterized protein n=1 Tax=Nocardia vulneris TaxID=1141657 RepID=A0ABR4Z6L7_9NOCA|nr:hypothetical protein [Nocardia vulneris]KIA60838.1 hypothetical protein FG87_34720 [Nocardia vulneris]